jgi:hypothetical protein
MELQPDSAKKRSEEDKFFIENFGDVITQGVQPRHMAILYDKSSAFRDAMDKSAFAIARTDMDAVAQDVTPKFQALDAQDPEQNKVKKDGISYVATLRKTFENVGNVVYEALMGDPRDKEANFKDRALGEERLRFNRNKPSRFLRHDGTVNDKRQAEAMEALNGLGEEIAIKNRFQDFSVYTKNKLSAEGRLDNDTLDALLAAGLTVTHSRWLGADDPAMAEHKLKAEKEMQVRIGR